MSCWRAQVQANATVGALRLAESSFERLVGVSPPENLILPTAPQVDVYRDIIPQAQADRPDVRALHLTMLQSQAVVTQLQGRIFWPTLDFGFFGRYQMLLTGSTPSFGVSGILTLPLFQTGDEWVQVKAQRQRVRINFANESYLRRQVGDDVRQAIARLQTAKTAIELATDELKTANKNYELVSTQYKVGAATVLELVTAQAAVFEAETNKTLGIFDRELATYQLLFAQGKIDL
jgi:outer membrane protein TolC